MQEAPKNVGWFRNSLPASREEPSGKAEALKILDRDALSLGDLNPLIHPTDLTRKESVDAVKLITLHQIGQHGGSMPTTLESTAVYDPVSEKSGLRFIARFEAPSLTEQQLVLLERLVKQTYGATVRTRTDSKGNDMPTENYPPIQRGEETKSKTGGWYMGPDMSPTTSLHQGLFVFKDLGQVNKNNFLKNRKASTKYIVELREAGQYQTDLVSFATQVAAVLGQGELLDQGKLLYETYYDLIRLGLKKMDAGSIYGMDEAISMIKRSLLTPLASPDLSRGIKEDPQSVLMVGVPGTGKTLVVEELLHEETGLFIVPIDALELQKELSRSEEEQRLLSRIAEVGRITGKRVILHIDDIEKMVEEDKDTHSTMLNLMAGVKESGFYIIASTNRPEKIDPALLQPQRFGVLIYCGLQNEQARYEILKIHASMESMRLGKPLFKSDEIRDLILKEVADHTQYFTPRRLAHIATIAKSLLMERIAADKGNRIGLTEEDLEGYSFSLEDWKNAFAQAFSEYDREDVRKRDDELRGFVNKHKKGTVGFARQESRNGIFSQEVFDRVAAMEAELRGNDAKSKN